MKLTNVKNFDVNTIVFSDPKKFVVNYKFVKILTKKDNENLIVATDKCFSWGVQNSKDRFSNGSTSYEIPIVLKNKDKDGKLNPTEYQKGFLSFFKKVVKKCKDYCIENKDNLEKHDLEKRDLKNMSSCIFVKKENAVSRNGKTVLQPVENYPPTLYAKLIYNKKNKKILTPFYEMKNVKTIMMVEKKSILNHFWVKNVL